MATPCVPTLGSQTYLTDIPQILVYQFRYYILMPKNRTTIYIDQTKSFSDTVSNVGYDRTVLAKTVEDDLAEIYNRIFANSDINVTVDCETETVAGTRYNLTVTIIATDGNTVYTTAPVVKTSDGIFTIANDEVYKEVI